MNAEPVNVLAVLCDVLARARANNLRELGDTDALLRIGKLDAAGEAVAGLFDACETALHCCAVKGWPAQDLRGALARCGVAP